MKAIRTAFVVTASFGIPCLAIACGDSEPQPNVTRTTHAMTASTVCADDADVPEEDHGPCGLNVVLEGTNCCEYAVVGGVLKKTCSPLETADVGPVDSGASDTSAPDSGTADTRGDSSSGATDTATVTYDSGTAPTATATTTTGTAFPMGGY